MASCRAIFGMAMVLLALLTGCGEVPDLPQPGAENAVLYLWRPGEPQPSTLHCVRAVQDGPDPQHLALTEVTVTAPLRDGVLRLQAPTGHYAATDLTPLRLNGPVVIMGRGRERPFVGVAQSAMLRDGGDTLALKDLQLIQDAQSMRFTEAQLQDVWASEVLVGSGQQIESQPAPPVVAAALAALTRPVETLP